MESLTDEVILDLPEELVDELVQLARELGVSVSKLAVTAIKEYLDAHA